MEDLDQQKKLRSKNAIVDLPVICVAVFVGVFSGLFAWLSAFKGMSDSPIYVIVLIGVCVACLIYKKRGIIIGICTSGVFSLLFMLLQISDSSRVSNLIPILLNSILYILIGWAVGWMSERDFRNRDAENRKSEQADDKSVIDKKKLTETSGYPYYINIPAIISIVMMGQFLLICIVNDFLPDSFFGLSGGGGVIGFFIMLGTIIVYTVWSVKKRN